MSVRWAKRILSADEAGLAKWQGFPLVQMPLYQLSELSDGQFVELRDKVCTLGLLCESFESPLPPGMKVTERGFNIYSWTEFIKKALDRASNMGCKILVWGDAKARILPIEGETSILKEHFNQFLFMLSDIAGQHGITIGLEPFGPRRTNFLNSLKEVSEIIDSIGKSNLSIAVSLTDIVETCTSLDELKSFHERIVHVHAENPASQKTLMPPAPFDGNDYEAFFAALREIGYQGIIALPPASDEKTLLFCRKLWEKTQGQIV
jgi:sugar phosphate isomerase/epimerase